MNWVVLYTGRAIHGGGANRSEHVRRALNVDYVLGYVDDVRDPGALLREMGDGANPTFHAL